MPTMSFLSEDPTLHALDVDHGQLGLEVERIMASPAYWDQSHPLHMRAVSDVTARLSVIHGQRPVEGGQPFAPMTIYTGGEPDEHNVRE